MYVLRISCIVERNCHFKIVSHHIAKIVALKLSQFIKTHRNIQVCQELPGQQSIRMSRTAADTNAQDSIRYECPGQQSIRTSRTAGDTNVQDSSRYECPGQHSIRMSWTAVDTNVQDSIRYERPVSLLFLTFS
jgi:hypothetical protein